MELKDKLVNTFREFETHLNGNAGSAIHKVRRNAIEKFSTLGFPTTHLEDWKYTSVEPFLKNDFQIFYREKKSSAKISRDQFCIPGLKCNRLVFINGFFSEDHSEITGEHPAIVIQNLAEAGKQFPEVFEKHFAQHSSFERDGFNAINTAFAMDGAFIMVPDNSEVKTPIHLIYVTDATGANVFSQPRNLILIGKNSKVSIIESYHALGANYSFSNVVEEIIVEDNAEIDYYKIQNLSGYTSRESGNDHHVATTQVNLSRDSRYTVFTVSLSGEFIRNNMNIVLGAENSEGTMYGLYLPKGNELIDNHTLVDHAFPNCRSNELYKGVMDEQSKAVFNGRIIVRKDAQKTNAFQSNKNILLSDAATVNTKPQLEIFADDVKCSHGATSGQLDEEAMFYLKSRGLSDAQAKAMLTLAFVEEVISYVKIDALRLHLEDLIEKRLSKN